ncbi:MAG: N-acetyltransferase [Acidimicrobiia bacterium]|nr:N-acetyltransferase [Acidimicrobiia bacterium]
MEPLIREATKADLDRVNEIFDTVIVDTHISFDTEPWTREQREAWFETKKPPHIVLVAEVGGELVGISYSSPLKPKRAYDSSVETTIVLDPAVVGEGIGTRLLETLLEHLEDAGFHRAYAHIALPNDASVAAHEKLGYELIGIQDEVGHKLDKFWSVGIWEKKFA